MKKQFASYLGSARASRAKASSARTDGASAIANFFAGLRFLPAPNGIDCGEAPQSAREPRALLRRWRQFLRLGVAFYVATLAACETTNYAPLITTEMARAGSAKK